MEAALAARHDRQASLAKVREALAAAVLPLAWRWLGRPKPGD